MVWYFLRFFFFAKGQHELCGTRYERKSANQPLSPRINMKALLEPSLLVSAANNMTSLGVFCVRKDDQSPTYNST